MRTIIKLINILLLSLFLFNIYNNTIEPYCNPQLSSDDLCKREYEQQIYNNEENIDLIKNKIDNLKTKFKNIKIDHDLNIRNNHNNSKALRKMVKINKGEKIDNTEACEKHPEAC
tara:strand:+ start:1011 stop:1355 length:345 start_codon:yes stop_codon:yes gene_type:complete